MLGVSNLKKPQQQLRFIEIDKVVHRSVGWGMQSESKPKEREQKWLELALQGRKNICETMA